MMCEVCAFNICDLPSELIFMIVDNIGDKDYLVNLKKTCMLFSKSISQFYIARQIVSRKYGLYTILLKGRQSWCMNPNCSDDSKSIVEYIWNYGQGNYTHHTQFALNATEIVVNGKPYNFKSHYCCECLKKHVLIGDRKNVSQHYGDYYKYNMQVNISYNNKPTPSTWTNQRTLEKEPLFEWQVMMLEEGV